MSEGSESLLSVAPSHDLGTMLVCTVRYALGRKSYIVGEVAHLVRRYYGACSSADKAIIQANVEEHLGSQFVSDPANIRREWVALSAWIAENAP